MALFKTVMTGLWLLVSLVLIAGIPLYAYMTGAPDLVQDMVQTGIIVSLVFLIIGRLMFYLLKFLGR